MKDYILYWLVAALIFMIFNTTDNASGDTMKAVSIIAICSLIGFIWRIER